MTIPQILARAFCTGIVCYIACSTALALCVYINEWTHIDVFWPEL